MKKKIIRIIVASLLLIGAVIIEKNCSLEVYWLLLIYLIPYIVAGYDVILEAIEEGFKGNLFNEDFLMAIATIGALCIGFLPNTETEFLEAVFVMLFFQVGEVFEDYASDNSRKSIASLMNIRPERANVEENGEIKEYDPQQVKVNSIIIIRPGEKVPLDGVIIEGNSALNTVALTGESLPKDVSVSDEIVSGCINISGVLKVRVTKKYEDSTVAKIINLVENSAQNKSKSETFIRRFAKVYTPIVVICAVVLAFVPPLFAQSFATCFPIWLNRALTFLVVSCPCALVISVPLTFFGGIGGASKKGILIKGGAYMDTLSKVSTMVFDKTGTLTKGQFEVSAVHPDKITENQLLHLVAHAERFSSHPIAISLKNAYPNENDSCSVMIEKEIAGQGIIAKINDKTIAVGNTKLMDALHIQWHDCSKVGTIIHVAINDEYAGHIVISDKIKSDSKSAMQQLRNLGINKLIMLTGDKQEVAKSVSEELGLTEFYAGLLPQDKVSWVKKIVEENKQISNNNKVAFIGDGINDAPVLALSDVGIAMGGLGSDAAIEAADIVLMDDKPSKIATAIKIARKTLQVASQNVVFAILIKVLVLVLASFGVATMWMAVFADVGVMVLCVLNATRMIKIKNI
ncbi:MAG: heavy metal translocating P-type ATPase [Bacteroidota bacterium]|nr:heavy metal translocating P-type ATPase [Bacteroidota bacterium]